MPSSSKNESTDDKAVLVPMVAGLTAAGALSIGFGAGYGLRSFANSYGYKELLEKFPDPPTKEAEALARKTAVRALAAGTGLAACMAAAAVVYARASGVDSIDAFADEVRRWLPKKETLASGTARLEPLQRTISENLQSARELAGRRYHESQLGQSLDAHAKQSSESGQAELQPWEREILSKIKALEEDDLEKRAPPPK